MLRLVLWAVRYSVARARWRYWAAIALSRRHVTSELYSVPAWREYAAQQYLDQLCSVQDLAREWRAGQLRGFRVYVKFEP